MRKATGTGKGKQSRAKHARRQTAGSRKVGPSSAARPQVLDEKGQAAMEQPRQAAPVNRAYLRALVGRKAKPADRPPASGGRRAAPPGDGDYLVELKPFHVRRWRGGQ